MIGGEKRIVSNDEKRVNKVGIFMGDVVKLNPDEQWLAENNMPQKEGSKATQYLGTSEAGNRTVRLDFWVKESNTQQLYKVGYYLEDTDAVTRNGDKKYYINTQGSTSCVTDESELKDWFKKYDYRVAKKGEKELVNFLKSWLIEIKRDENLVINPDLDKLFKGNYKELEQEIGGEYAKPVVLPLTIKTVTKEGEVKEYMEVFNRAVTPHYNMKYFINKSYSQDYLDKLRDRESRKDKIKGYEDFIAKLAGNYGTRNFYSLKPIHDYDPTENIVGSADKDLSEDSGDY